MPRLNLTVNKIVIALAITVLVAVSLFLFHEPTHRMIVINKASTPIADLVVTVCGKDYEFNSMSPADRVSAVFEITGDSGFLVNGSFADGKKITGGFGYVTKNIAKQSVVITVHDDGSAKGKQ